MSHKDKITEKDCIECGLCCYFPTCAGKMVADVIKIGADDWCIHYNKDKGCSIHENKPQVCKDFETGGEECLYVLDMNNKKLLFGS